MLLPAETVRQTPAPTQLQETLCQDAEMQPRKQSQTRNGPLGRKSLLVILNSRPHYLQVRGNSPHLTAARNHGDACHTHAAKLDESRTRARGGTMIRRA